MNVPDMGTKTMVFVPPGMKGETEKTSGLPEGTRRWRDKCTRVLQGLAQGTGAEADGI